ncbi:MAG: disulfide bond formation protein B [Chlamydiales bacterium]|nr:disulfide bond formation protein B [Chlamydiales bacterium]MBY0529894.1 disulfide bond formation protein B [Rhabdochlamydiaceae bacterium]
MHRKIFIALGIVSGLILSMALMMEFVFHQQACKLCYLQRIPYFLILVSSLYGLYSKRPLIVLRIIQGILTVGFLIASYHSAIIFGIVDDPCLLKPRPHDLQSFKALMEAPLPCSASTWQIFDMPISVLNAIFSVFLIASIQRALKQEDKVQFLNPQ